MGVWLTGEWPVLDGRRMVWPSIARVRGRRSRWRAGSVGEGVALSGPPQAGEVRHEIAWGVFIGELQIGVSLGVRRSDTLVHAGEGAAGTAPVSCGNAVLHVHVHGRPGFQTAFTFFGYFRYGLLRGN